jgi:hypothetical protein
MGVKRGWPQGRFLRVLRAHWCSGKTGERNVRH